MPRGGADRLEVMKSREAFLLYLGKRNQKQGERKQRTGRLPPDRFSAGKLFGRMTDALATAGDEGRGKPR